MKTFLVTEAFINAGQRSSGGWSREQLAIIGVPWPPRKGWKSRTVEAGVTISEEDAESFLRIRDQRVANVFVISTVAE